MGIIDAIIGGGIGLKMLDVAVPTKKIGGNNMKKKVHHRKAHHIHHKKHAVHHKIHHVKHKTAHHMTLGQMEKADVKSWQAELAADVKSWKAENAADKRNWQAELRSNKRDMKKLGKTGW